MSSISAEKRDRPLLRDRGGSFLRPGETAGMLRSSSHDVLLPGSFRRRGPTPAKPLPPTSTVCEPFVAPNAPAPTLPERDEQPAPFAPLNDFARLVRRTRTPPPKSDAEPCYGGGISGTGDVEGPGSSTDNAIARYAGTTGKVIQNSALTLSDLSGNNVNISTPAAAPATKVSIRAGDHSGGGGAGANVEISGGDGTSFGSGGSVVLEGGEGGATGNGGSVSIQGGPGAFGPGAINIGTATAGTISIGKTGVTTTIKGTLGLANALAINNGGTGAGTADDAFNGLLSNASAKTPDLASTRIGVRIGSFFTQGGFTSPQALYDLINSLFIESTPEWSSPLAIYESGTKQVTRANLLGHQRYAFYGYRSSDYNQSGNTFKILLNAELFDVNGVFNTSSSRFQPAKSGYYQVGATVSYHRGNNGQSIQAKIYKNGSLYSDGDIDRSNVSSGDFSSAVSTLVYLNGSTDYLELWARKTGGGTDTIRGGSARTFLYGYLVVPD